MTDDKRLRGEPDRHRVARLEDYEVAYFARLHKVSEAIVRDLIRKHGNDREVLTAKVNELK